MLATSSWHLLRVSTRKLFRWNFSFILRNCVSSCERGKIENSRRYESYSATEEIRVDSEIHCVGARSSQLWASIVLDPIKPVYSFNRLDQYATYYFTVSTERAWFRFVFDDLYSAWNIAAPAKTKYNIQKNIFEYIFKLQLWHHSTQGKNPLWEGYLHCFFINSFSNSMKEFGNWDWAINKQTSSPQSTR